jgi:hypothetical protein
MQHFGASGGGACKVFEFVKDDLSPDAGMTTVQRYSEQLRLSCIVRKYRNQSGEPRISD